ncbi:ribosome silencing factor [bacterium]|nr:ribosome silencing factor [bacterium]
MLIAQGMEKRRALEVMVLDMRELMAITDYFILCHGRSHTHVEAIGSSVEEYMEEHGLRPDHREGGRGARWLILDYGSAVAHVFTEEARDFYDLERLWEDAPVVEHVSLDSAAEMPSEES